MNYLLDYVFGITQITPVPAASTAFLKQAIVVAKPKDGGVTTGFITLCTSMAQVNLLVGANAAAEVQQLFNGGLSKVYILPEDDLDLAADLVGHENDAWTMLISSDFGVDDIFVEAAYGGVTITSYANLVSGTADTVSVAGVTFTAQAGAVTPGDTTFQAASSNELTAASLAAQINSHATVKLAVTATVVGAIITITANETGLSGNNIAVAYVDNGSVGATLQHLVGGKLSGGGGLFPGLFKGVIGVSSTDDTFLQQQAAIPNRSAWHTTSANKSKNMFFEFGKFLSNQLNWSNLQYSGAPFADDVVNLGMANNLFEKRISFVLSDDQYSNRVGLFAAGGEAIVAPYIAKNLEVDLQSKALQYMAANQPGYTLVQAALLEDELKKVIALYVDKPREWITAGTISITLEQDNFVASGRINIAKPKAMWRIFGEMRQTL